MENRRGSFVQSLAWAGYLLLAMGAVFLAIAAVTQFVPLNPENINLSGNWANRLSGSEIVRRGRLILLLVFGLIGLGLAAAGAAIAGRDRAQRALSRRLKAEGVCLNAEVVECIQTMVHVGSRNLLRLRCVYAAPGGKTIPFKSRLLRADPTPYLKKGRVSVYCDRGDMRKYYVDVDGSVAPSEVGHP